MSKINLLFTFVFLFSILSEAGTHYSIDLRTRTKPQGTTPTATMAYDGMLWGEASKTNPLYGYYRIGGKLGGTPNYAAFLQIAPIAPLVLEVQRGYTHRFLNVNKYDCDDFDCRGKIERTDYIARLAAGFGRFVFLGSAMWRELRTEESNKRIALEIEYFDVPPGFHRFFETNLLAGYRLPNEHIVGIMTHSAILYDQDQKSSSLYGVYRMKWEDYGLAFGAGNYNSDNDDYDGFSAVLMISRSWGETLSLF